MQNAIGFYLHIPFPPWQTFMAIPEHQQLARAVAAYDLIGLQTQADVGNLMRYLENAVFGRIVPDGRIRVFDRLVSIASFPVGIDVDDFANVKRDTGLVQARTAVSRIIGIDRLDYTKGLPHKFKAFGRFLDKYPQYRGQVVLTQIAPPTREDVEAYTDIRQQLESLAGSINGRFGELDWVPIHYIHRSTPRRRLGDIYRSSRICMVTPLRDGMNLVAKEYVAAQDPADPGVLILSQFAGAAEEMTEALIVNPYNIEETADVIRQPWRCRWRSAARYKALMAAVRKYDVAPGPVVPGAARTRARADDPMGDAGADPRRAGEAEGASREAAVGKTTAANVGAGAALDVGDDPSEDSELSLKTANSAAPRNHGRGNDVGALIGQNGASILVRASRGAAPDVHRRHRNLRGASDGGGSPLTLGVDIGGTNVKASVLDRAAGWSPSRCARRRPKPATPKAVLKAIEELAARLPSFDRISVGFPGVVKSGTTITAPNLGTEHWAGVRADRGRRRAIRRAGARAQRCGRAGSGRGAGPGPRVRADARHRGRLRAVSRSPPAAAAGTRPAPRPQGQDLRPVHRAGGTGRERPEAWNGACAQAIGYVSELTVCDMLYVGGGNARKITFKLPQNVKIVSNTAGITGGVRLWEHSLDELFRR